MAQIARDLAQLGYTDLVSVTPPGAELAPNSSLPANQLGKIPGLRRPDGYWVGYNWREKQVPFEAIDKSGANIGILATRYPGLDIDSDDPALTLWAKHIADDVLGWAPVRLSRAPRRLLMYVASEPIKKRKLLVEYEGTQHAIELLGDGQQYLIHGTHPSGKRYRWASDAKIPSSGPGGLSLIDEEKVDRYFEELSSYLTERGCEILNGGDGREVPQVVDSEIVEGTGRNVTLTSLAGSMRRRGMGFTSILAALQAENEEKCSPPMTPEEVEQIAHSVVRYEPEEAQQVVDAAQVFKPVEVEEKPFTPAFTYRRADEAMAEDYDPHDWLVDGMIPRLTGYTMLNSKPKVGKSTFARSLAVAVSNGDDFLGKATAQVPVMYVSFPFEGDEEQNARELKKLGKAAPNLWISGKWERSVSRDDVIQTLVHIAKDVKPGLIVIDTVMKMLRMKDVKDYAEVQEVLAPLYHVLEPLGSHFLFLHHEKKGGVDDVIESGLGSIGLAGSAETVLRIIRDQDIHQLRILDGVGRQAGDIEPRILLMDETTGEPHLGPHPDAYKSKELIAKLAGYMHGMGENVLLTQEDCRGIMGCRREEVVRWLRASDLIEEVGSGVRGDPFRYRLLLPEFTGEEMPDADGSDNDEE
jgi:hypothetical protein